MSGCNVCVLKYHFLEWIIKRRGEGTDILYLASPPSKVLFIVTGKSSVGDSVIRSVFLMIKSGSQMLLED